MPFLSSEKKAEGGKVVTDTPGPGQYPSKGIREDLTKKVWGKQGAFGSTERRFAQLTSMVCGLSHGYRKLLDPEIIQMKKF